MTFTQEKIIIKKDNHKIRISPDEFHEFVNGRKRILPSRTEYSLGDRLLLREHNGHTYTGRDICGVIKQLDGKIMIFKLLSYDSGFKSEKDYQHEKRNI